MWNIYIFVTNNIEVYMFVVELSKIPHCGLEGAVVVYPVRRRGVGQDTLEGVFACVEFDLGLHVCHRDLRDEF